MITTSVFDLFKIGPGPSSSHTIGPMKAAYDFVQRVSALPIGQLAAATQLHIHLYGSLSATGKGHGTDRAIVAGLLGWQPETTNPDALLNLLRDPAETYLVQVADKAFPVNAASIHFERVRYDSPYANTMVLSLTDGSNRIASEEYYSIGGGFIIRKGQPDDSANPVSVPYPYSTMNELKAHLKASGQPLAEVLLANEMAVSGKSRKEVNTRIDALIEAMHKAVRRGLRHKGVLPGNIRLRRKAPALFQQARSLVQSADSFLIFSKRLLLSGFRRKRGGGHCRHGPHVGRFGRDSGADVFGQKPFSLRQNYPARRAVGGSSHWLSGEAQRQHLRG